MPSAFVPTGPLFSTDYIEQAQENAEEQFGGPGRILNSLAQGATGPAPAPQVDEDGNYQVEHPTGFVGINRDATGVLTGGDRRAFEDANARFREDGVSPTDAVKRILTTLAIIGVGLVLLNTILGGLAEGVAQR